MTKKNVTVNYNGEPLKADEVLVFTPYDEEDVKYNVTNKESVVTITKAGKSVKAVLKAVPKEFETVAKAQFNSWQREQQSNPTEGRCMIPQPDGTYKECPKKVGENRVSCTNCPNKGKFERKLIAKVSIEEQQDTYDLSLVESPAADHDLIEEENLTESQKRIVAKFETMLDKSPKHCLAMLLMGLLGNYQSADSKCMGEPVQGNIRNAKIIYLPEAVADWGTVTHFGLFSSASASEPFFTGELKNPIEITTGYVPIFRVGTLSITIV